MPLLPVAYDWGRLLTSLVLVLGLALELPVCELTEVNAQSRTTLTLLDQISGPGAQAMKGEPLPGKTQVVVLFENKSEFHTLPNLGTSHSGLAQRIRKGSGMKMRLQGGGQTSKKFGKTEGAGKIYYLLARTGEGKLYESYVPTETEGYQPGFNAVQSGNMAMGPVPKEHRDTLRAALESAFSAGNSEGSEDKSKPTLEESEKNTVTDGGRESGSTGYLQWGLALLPGGGALSAVLVFLFGVVISGIGTWILMKREVQNLRNDLGKRDKRIEGLKAELYNERKKPVSSEKDVSGFGREEKVENVRESKNKEIRVLKKKLKERGNKIEHLEEELKRIKGKLKRKDKPKKESDHLKGRSSRRNSRGSGSTGRRQSDSASGGSKATGDRPINAISQAFLRWCTDKGAAMRDRHTMFAKELKDRLPDAELQRIFREKNAAGIVFAEDAQDAVEYWLVRADGRDFLLPQPQRSGFREVDKCFEVEKSSPDQLQEFQPAELQSQGGKYQLQSKGKLA